MIARLVDRTGKWLVRRKMATYARFDPTRTCVLVLGAQRAFLDPESAWQRTIKHPVASAVLRTFLEASRTKGWHIVHSPVDLDAAQAKGSSARFFRQQIRLGALDIDRDGGQIPEELRNASDSLSHPYAGLNAFTNTDLAELLEAKDIGHVIIAGGVVNADVDSTARMAVELDYDVTIVSDLVAALSEKDRANTLHITLPRIVARVLTSAELEGAG
ncbi:isochorismatase family cysteine hydrolase [Erythrobacter rubeus]|uniref:Cysteine hydrolase n=1 Tax=Erythrobacter rubeus TaxID=2760803 RepID=A0ABR8KNR2_9SPHN|nr:isochorismatase family cysteine hydrolase [Erythrobacter rubeus]MBD2840860.1 cysteine hydrolase [Erythrobacter rubeus]